ncbi:MAG: nucleotidyltransferase domain-containing protein [Nitrososphaerota archaeon]|jgi:hypothetical protein|nr:nucleotidyltransferase domain-containing protein [Nitrososphaerota archaeon]
MSRVDELRCRVSREAAALLYFGVEKEYKQAKLRAAEIIGVHFLPTNFEVALELDALADEKEGYVRKERLFLMRQEALKFLKLLAEFCPLLIGSVWRGTARLGSDIDIAVYTDSPGQVLKLLRDSNVIVHRSCWSRVNKQGVTLSSFHIYAETETKNSLEITIRSSDEADKKRKCNIFGDEIKGLNIFELGKLLKENATKQFLP